MFVKMCFHFILHKKKVHANVSTLPFSVEVRGLNPYYCNLLLIDKIYTSRKACTHKLHYFLFMHVQTRRNV